MALPSISPRQAFGRIGQGARLIDLRSDNERAAGMAEGAEAIAMDALLADPAAHLDARETLLICQKGVRSANAVAQLAEAGFALSSVEGGTEAWRADGLPMDFRPDLFDSAVMGDDPYFGDRYARQLRLPTLGKEGQIHLSRARVVIVGAGGLGSPAAFYLAAAGVGHLTLIDPDTVDRSNLHRQILHTDAAVGLPKVASAEVRLRALNPFVNLTLVQTAVDTDNAAASIAGADVVIDGSDNFAVRHALNAACVAARIPLVYGAVDQFTGQVAVFNAGPRGEAPCYRCLFPEAPSGVLNCAEAGVLGVVPGVVGLLQATEALKLILGLGETLAGALLRIDLLTMRFKRVQLVADPECPACGLT